jgi:hypothetical protein
MQEETSKKKILTSLEGTIEAWASKETSVSLAFFARLEPRA